MYIKLLVTRTNLHTHLKEHQKSFRPSGMMPLESSVFLLEKLTPKSSYKFLSYSILVKNFYGGHQ